MANLCFRTIREGSETLNDAAPNFYSSAFNLTGFVDRTALLLMEISGVEFTNNFVTINAPDHAALNGLTTDNAAAVLDDKFVGRILPSGDNANWAMTIFRVKPELLAAGNVLGVHARNSGGGTSGNRDDFKIARAFLIYTGSD